MFLIYLQKYDFYYFRVIKELVGLTDDYHYRTNNSLSTSDLSGVLNMSNTELDIITYSLVQNKNYYLTDKSIFPKFSLFFQDHPANGVISEKAEALDDLNICSRENELYKSKEYNSKKSYFGTALLLLGFSIFQVIFFGLVRGFPD